MKGPGWLRGPCHKYAELGSATPVTLVLGLVFIVFPVLVMVLSLPAWEVRAVDAQDASRVAARAMVTADNWAEGLSAAEDAVSAVAEGDGVPEDDVTVTILGSLDAGAQVTASVTVLVPAANVPFLGLVGSFHFTATSIVHVDSYRDSPS